MEVNLPNATNNRLTARLVRASGGELITEQDISMTRVPLGDYFCGVLARNPVDLRLPGRAGPAAADSPRAHRAARSGHRPRAGRSCWAASTA